MTAMTEEEREHFLSAGFLVQEEQNCRYASVEGRAVGQSPTSPTTA
ncbi:hypothetical protein [Nocardiopsis xinjiangensis]|nr:hypothetical protein [Nocardiopsis xinjiangensis]